MSHRMLDKTNGPDRWGSWYSVLIPGGEPLESWPVITQDLPHKQSGEERSGGGVSCSCQ